MPVSRATGPAMPPWRQPVTQTTIAARLGVSPSLVSRALRGTADQIHASPATIARIRREAERVGYQPNAAALSLRGDSTQTIALVVKDFSDPFLGQIIGELQRAAAADGYALLLTGVGGAQQAMDWRTLMKYGVDGLVLVGSHFEPVGLDAFVKRRVAVARIGVGPKRRGVRQVAMDERSGLAELVEALVARGHRRFGFLGNGSKTSNLRQQMVAAALRRHGLPLSRRWFVSASGAEAGYRAAQQLWSACAGSGPTAVIATDDVAAQLALRGFYDLGVRVPEQISVAGVDDLPSSARTIPSLTTVRQPVPELVRQAFTWLTQSARSEPAEVWIKPVVVMRESCGGAPARDQAWRADLA